MMDDDKIAGILKEGDGDGDDGFLGEARPIEHQPHCSQARIVIIFARCSTL